MTITPLGKKIPNPRKYNPGILHPIPRWPARSRLKTGAKFHGFDHWHAYELSWLDPKGKPVVAVGEIVFDANSENIVESKSLKLYLNSLNQEKFDGCMSVATTIANDLTATSNSEVRVAVTDMEEGFVTESTDETEGEAWEMEWQEEGNDHGKILGRNIDSLDVEISTYEPDENLLETEDSLVINEILISNLFRSNCPVTGAPDWASLGICYSGKKISESALLRYICSYRQHQAYHEECAERIYRDIRRQCEPRELILSLNFLRRGGLDINVYRSTAPMNMGQILPRTYRQ